MVLFTGSYSSLMGSHAYLRKQVLALPVGVVGVLRSKVLVPAYRKETLVPAPDGGW